MLVLKGLFSDFFFSYMTCTLGGEKYFFIQFLIFLKHFSN